MNLLLKFYVWVSKTWLFDITRWIERPKFDQKLMKNARLDHYIPPFNLNKLFKRLLKAFQLVGDIESCLFRTLALPNYDYEWLVECKFYKMG